MSCFPVTSKDVDLMLHSLSQEHVEMQDEIKQLSRTWVAAVMGQPSKQDKSQPRSFEYSKQKISDVLKWRQENELLASDVQERITTDGDPKKQGSKYIRELNSGSFYW